MRRTPRTTAALPTLLSLAVIVLVGCATPAPDSEGVATAPGTTPTSTLDARDLDALGQVERAAIKTAARGEPATTAVECWVPSGHLVEAPDSDTVFRILCRVHYVEAGADRYLDLTCIGDFELNPMLDHCYPWLYYTEVPRFEDAEAVWASAPGRGTPSG